MLTQKGKLFPAAAHNPALAAPPAFPGKWVHSLGQGFNFKLACHLLGVKKCGAGMSQCAAARTQ